MTSKRARNGVACRCCSRLLPGLNLGTSGSFSGLAGYQGVLCPQQIRPRRSQIAGCSFGIGNQGSNTSALCRDAVFRPRQLDLRFNRVCAQSSDLVIARRDLRRNLRNESRLCCAALERIHPVSVGHDRAAVRGLASNAEDLSRHQTRCGNAGEERHNSGSGEGDNGRKNNRGDSTGGRDNEDSDRGNEIDRSGASTHCGHTGTVGNVGRISTQARRAQPTPLDALARTVGRRSRRGGR